MHSPLVQRLRERADSAPDDLLFTWVGADGRDAGQRRAGQLLGAGGAVAGLLRAQGVRPGEVVALVYPPGLELVDALVGCLLAGAVPAPLYPPDPLRDDPRTALLASVAQDTSARFALTTARYRRAWQLARVRHFVLGGPKTGLTWLATDGLGADAVEAASASLEDTAILQYTSGSTSAPRGVEITHANLAHQLEHSRTQLGLGPDRRAVAWLPQYHDFGLISMVLSSLWGNGSVWLMSPMSFLQRPGLWLEVIDRVRAHATAAPDFGYALVTRRTRPEERARWDLSCLQLAMSAAEPIRQQTVAGFLEAFGPHGFRPDAFCPAYGLAEHTVGVTLWGSGPRAFDRDALQRGQLSPPRGGEPVWISGCGRAAFGVEVTIVDAAGAPLPEGQVGEILVRSPSVARGYRNRPDATRERFDADGWLHTGDLGALVDGELFVTGRARDLVIVGGRNLHPEDIEQTARLAHPDVRAGGVAAFGVEHDGAERLVVAVEAESEHPSAVARAVADRVAAAHRVRPLAVVVLAPRTLPKTTSGKIRRSACAEAWLSGQWSGPMVRSDGAVLEPAPPLRDALSPDRAPGDARAAVLEALRARVAGLLGVPVDRLAPDASVVEAGLDSLQLADLAAWLTEELGDEARVAAALAAPTLEQMAARLLDAEGGVPAPRALLTPPSPPAGPGPHPLHFTEQLLLDAIARSPAYPGHNLFRVFDVHGALDRDRLVAALGVVVARHDALRTSYDLERRVATVLDEVAPVPVELHDLSDPAALGRVHHALLHEVLDPARPPLLRLAYARTGPGRGQLSWLVSHLVCDGQSVATLVGEVDEVYRALGEGRAPNLPELHGTFRARVRSLPPEALPGPHADDDGRCEVHLQVIDPDRVARIARLARAHGVFPSAIALAALQVALVELRGWDPVRIGVTRSGRTERERGLVGFLAHLHVLDAPRSQDPTERIGAAHRELLASEARLVVERPMRPGEAVVFNFHNYALPLRIGEVSFVPRLDLTPARYMWHAFDLCVDVFARPGPGWAVRVAGRSTAWTPKELRAVGDGLLAALDPWIREVP